MMAEKGKCRTAFPLRQTRRPDGGLPFSYADRIVQTKRVLDLGASEVETQGKTGVDGAIVEALSEIKPPDWSSPEQTERWVNEIMHAPLRQTRNLGNSGLSRRQIMLRQFNLPVLASERSAPVQKARSKSE